MLGLVLLFATFATICGVLVWRMLRGRVKPVWPWVTGSVLLYYGVGTFIGGQLDPLDPSSNEFLRTMQIPLAMAAALVFGATVRAMKGGASTQVAETPGATPQLVGQICAACGRKIVLASEGARCEACGVALHADCASAHAHDAPTA